MKTLFAELRGYIQFDAAATEALATLRTELADDLAGIVDKFYVAIDATPGAAAIITNPAQRERLKNSMLGWLQSGLAGPHDEAFLEQRARIGKKHVQIRLPQQYMFTAMNVIRTGYHDSIHRRMPTGQRQAAHRAVDQLLDLELALMLHTYKHDSEERVVRTERSIQDERMHAMQTLTAGLAHEVRNPLNAAKLQLELLERRLRRAASEPRLIETTQVAHHEISRLTLLLNEFLSFARPPQLGATTHDLADIIRQVLKAERPLAEASHVELRLAPVDGPILAEFDAGKLHQVLQNLIRNAIEAVLGREAPVVDIEVAQQGADEVVVVIRDNGSGIADEVAVHIYEPFYSTKEGGTGLGMAIVHSLLSLHGGTIVLDTSPRGTTFTVTLRRWLRA